MSPLFVYALRVDNFFTQRSGQVKLINGAWSPYQNVEITPKNVSEILKKQTFLSIKSLYTDGIGGHGGYVFGNFALFDNITFVFLLISLIYLLFTIIEKGDSRGILIAATILASFIVGVVLTFPPPAFHRFSLAFPFIALLIAVMIIHLFYSLFRKRSKIAATLILSLCLFTVLMGNVIHFSKILAGEQPDNPDYPLIEYYLDQKEEKMVYIAAFPSYGLGRFLFVRSEGTINSTTMFLDELLTVVPDDRTSTLIVLYPDEHSLEKVMAKFPNTKVIGQYTWHLILSVS